MPLFDVYPLYDVEPTKARGVYVYDKNGNKYLDSVSYTHLTLPTILLV